MTAFFPTFLTLWLGGYRFMARADRALEGRIPSILEWDRSAKQGRLPSFRMLAGSLPRYAHIGYDPAHEASTEQARAYLESSPAARAATAGA